MSKNKGKTSSTKLKTNAPLVLRNKEDDKDIDFEGEYQEDEGVVEDEEIYCAILDED